MNSKEHKQLLKIIMNMNNNNREKGLTDFPSLFLFQELTKK